MNLLEIVEKAKTAKRKGKEFEYSGTGAFFEFRGLSMEEMSDVFAGFDGAEGVASKLLEDDHEARARKIRQMADQINKVMAMDTLIGFRGLTNAIFEDIAKIDLQLSQEELNDFIICDSKDEKQRKAANEAMRLMAKDTAFAMFVAASVMDATTESHKEIQAQKKISSNSL